MPDFTQTFLKSKGEPTTYNGRTIVLSHKFPVKNGDTLVASIEKTNSDCRQGFCIDIIGACEIHGEIHKAGKGVRMLFWADTAPEKIKLKVVTTHDYVWIENIWEKSSVQTFASLSGETISRESKYTESRYFGSAMIVEEMIRGFRYRCNDWHPDDNFDDIVFTVRKSLNRGAG